MLRAKQTLPNVFFSVLANYSIRASLITEKFSGTHSIILGMSAAM